MFERLRGRILALHEKAVTIECGGIGFFLHVPQPGALEVDKEASYFVYWHWTAEQGPSLYGFLSERDRAFFLCIIECPKIGPSLALSMMAQRATALLIDLIIRQDQAGLSTISGVGAKKAESLVVLLREKIMRLYEHYPQEKSITGALVAWQELRDVLGSLSYSKQEINQAVSYLTDYYKDRQPSLDLLIRSALHYLSTKVP